uniref:Uncharacterized protein n=1 Tax=Lactuca sativa TaxID=4236 RepID=A0A9R1WMF1_LACSA|nr:hypothetical protein LSAT_V11C100040500 [Lactuca sativa]
MSPLKLSLGWRTCSWFDIEGPVKMQPMAAVEEKVLHCLGLTNLDFSNSSSMRIDVLGIASEESEIEMYYMLNWITDGSKGHGVIMCMMEKKKEKKRCVRLLQVMELHHWSTSHWISDYNRKQMANCALGQGY